MSETPPAKPSASQVREPRTWPWSWLFASLIFTLAISLAAAHAPPRIRLIGLFSVAFGLIVGWSMNRLVEMLNVDSSRRFVEMIVAIFTVGGLVGSTCEVVRMEIMNRGKSPRDGLAARMIEEMETQSKPSERQDSQPTKVMEFRRHLSYRIRQLGDWSSPWPEFFWMAELIAGATASVWISRPKHLNAIKSRSAAEPMK
jgi:hypothetical protein